MRRRVFFRADGGSSIGLGHVVRSLALANMLNQFFDCIFLIRTPLSALKNEILSSCCELHELSADVKYEEEAQLLCNTYLTREDIVVLDGYNFTTSYQQIIKQRGCKLVCIDDLHSYQFVADVIINHAPGIIPEQYSALPTSQLYLGLEYALIRKVFLDAARSEKPDGDPNRVFVCLGGADPHNHTIEVLEALLKLHNSFSMDVVIGKAYLHISALQEFVNNNNLNISIHSALAAEELLVLMQQCSRAVCSPSTISIEYLAATKGCLFLKKIADNQADFYTYLIKNGYAFDIGECQKAETRAYTWKTISGLDGFQGDRFIDIFQNI